MCTILPIIVVEIPVSTSYLYIYIYKKKLLRLIFFSVNFLSTPTWCMKFKTIIVQPCTVYFERERK